MGDVYQGKRRTTRIGSSRVLTQVQAGAGADHHRRRRELDRDLGRNLAVILGVEASRSTDCINHAEGAAEGKASSAQAAVAEAAAAATVAAAAIFHHLIRRLLNRPPAVHHATHFLPATFPTATRLHLLTGGVSRVERLHLTSGMRSRAATNLRTTRRAATATGARAALKEGHLSGGGDFHLQEASRGGGDSYEGYSAAGPDAYQPRHYSEPSTPQRSSSISSSSSHTVRHLLLLLQPLHLPIPGRLPRPLLFTSLG